MDKIIELVFSHWLITLAIMAGGIAFIAFALYFLDTRIISFGKFTLRRGKRYTHDGCELYTDFMKRKEEWIREGMRIGIDATRRHTSLKEEMHKRIFQKMDDIIKLIGIEYYVACAKLQLIENEQQDVTTHHDTHLINAMYNALSVRIRIEVKSSVYENGYEEKRNKGYWEDWKKKKMDYFIQKSNAYFMRQWAFEKMDSLKADRYAELLHKNEKTYREYGYAFFDDALAIMLDYYPVFRKMLEMYGALDIKSSPAGIPI